MSAAENPRQLDAKALESESQWEQLFLATPVLELNVQASSAVDTAYVTPWEVPAHHQGTWTFVYIPRDEGFVVGGAVVLTLPFDYSPSYRSWTYPQYSSPTSEGYLHVRTSRPSTEFTKSVWRNGYDFLVKTTFVSNPPVLGDTIWITFGDATISPDGQAWSSKKACSYRCPVLVDKSASGTYTRIQQEPCITVTARPAQAFHLVVPSLSAHGETLIARAVAHDEYYNRDPTYTGRLELSCTCNSACGAPAAFTFTAQDSGRVEAAFTPEPGRHQLTGTDSAGHMYWSHPFLVTPDPPQYRLYWADLHHHTEVSDGAGSLDDAFQFARDVAGLDVIAVTDHDHLHLTQYLSPNVWSPYVSATDRYLETGCFVTLIGFEWTPENGEGGHRHVLYRDNLEVPLSQSLYHKPEDLIQALGDTEALVMPHHVAWAFNSRQVDWSYRSDVFQRVVEIYSQHAAFEYHLNPLDRPLKAERAPGHYVRDALALGHRLGIVASSDGHFGCPGLGWMGADNALKSTARGTGLAGIYAEDLTREAIYDALFARRVFAVTDDRTILDFRINGAWMGSEIVSNSTPLLYGSVHSLTPIDTVELVKFDLDGYQIIQLTEDHSSRHFEFEITDTLVNDEAFYYLRVVSEGNENNRFAWSSPIWVTMDNHLPPKILDLPELAFFEDDSLTIRVGSWYDLVEDNDTPDELLAWDITCRYIQAQGDQQRKRFVLSAPPDWHGVDTLIVTVFDGEHRDSTQLVVRVLPVNDPPQSFSLREPPDSTIICLPADSRDGHFCKLTWGSTQDIDSEAFWYYSVLTDSAGLRFCSPDMAESRYLLSLDCLQEDLLALGDAPYVYWDVAATDGEDTCWSANGPFTLLIQFSDLQAEAEAPLPSEYTLHANYPNPFNLSTIIPFDVPLRGPACLAVYDILGEEIVRLVDEEDLEPGYHRALWGGRDRNGNAVASGIYIIRMTAPHYQGSMKLVLAK